MLLAMVMRLSVLNVILTQDAFDCASLPVYTVTTIL
jgi:hypothetical protein